MFLSSYGFSSRIVNAFTHDWENFFLLLVKLKLISTSFRLKNVCYEFESTRFWLKLVVKVEVELVVSLKLVVKNESNILNSAKLSQFRFQWRRVLNFSRTFHILLKTLNSILHRRCIKSANGICEFSKLFKKTLNTCLHRSRNK